MANAAISMMGTLAMVMMIALLGTMFQRRWSMFCAALLNQHGPLATPMRPTAETNVVMLRPASRAPLSRPQPPLALAA